MLWKRSLLNVFHQRHPEALYLDVLTFEQIDSQRSDFTRGKKHGGDVMRQALGRVCHSATTFMTCHAHTENKRRALWVPTPPHRPHNAHLAASLAHWVVLAMCQFNQPRLSEELQAALLPGNYFCFHKPGSSTSAQTYAQRRGAYARPYFHWNIKILNDSSASGIWQGLHVNHRRREAACRSDDCATTTLPHCDAAAVVATSVLLEVMGCELLVRGVDKM